MIDDEDSIRRAIRKAFPEQQVLEAASIADGLQLMQEGYPDLILLDQRLPDGEGMDTGAALAWPSMPRCRSCC